MATTYDQKVQDAMSAIQDRYTEVESWIAAMEAELQEIERLTPQLTKQTGWWIFKHTVVDMKVLNEIEQNQADIAKLNEQIAGASSGNSSMTALTDSIEDCIDTLNTASNQVGGKNDVRDANLLIGDLKVITNVLEDLIDALQSQVAIQISIDASSYLKQNGGTYSDISRFAQQMISEQSKQVDILTDLRLYLTDTQKEYKEDWNDADADLNNIRWYDYVFSKPFWFWSLPHTLSRKEGYEATMKNAEEMMQLSQEIKMAIAPLIAASSPGFQQIRILIEEILDKLLEVLNSNLSPEGKAQAVMEINQQVMAIFVQVVGLLTMVQQESMKQKAKTDAEMAESTVVSSDIGMDNSRAEIVKIIQNLAYAEAMGILMDVAKYTMMAVGSLAGAFSGGVASAVIAISIGMLFIALEASGVLDMMTKELSQSMGTLGAEIFIAGLEIALSLGGAAVAKVLVNKVMTDVVNRITEMVVEKGVKEAMKTVAANVADDITAQIAETAMKTAATKAATQASENVFFTYFERNGITVLIEWVKEAIETKGIMAGLDKVVLASMKEAAEEAAAKAAQDMADVVILVGKNAPEEALQTQALRIGEEAGNLAAARAAKVSVEDILDLRKGWEETASRMAKMGVAYGAFAVGSNNILVDLVKALSGDKEGEENEALMMVMQILQSLLMIIGQLGASGAATQWMKDMPAANRLFNQSASALTAVGVSTEALVAGSQYENEVKQAGAMKAQRMYQATLDIIFQLLAPGIDTRRKEQAAYDSEVIASQIRSNTYLAGSISSYLSTSAQVIAG